MATLIPFHIFLLLITISNLNSIVQSDVYIVHMDVSAMPESFTDHHSWYSATLASLSSNDDDSGAIASSSPNLLYSYTNALRGFSASLSDSELESLEKSPGFISWTRDARVIPHTTHTPTFLGLNSHSGAWPESKYGKKVIIGVIDSGVWPESESYKDHGMSRIPLKWKGKCVEDVAFSSSFCNKKLIGAQFFNKGIFAHNVNGANLTVNSTRDTEGHGTHTSAIAAGNTVRGASYYDYANGTARGIAIHAHLAVYKVLWDNHAYISDVVAGIDQAISDGVDVLSISMGWGADNLYEDPIAIASFAAMEKGIFVATSAGNDGPKYYSVNNGAPWVLSVGAGTVDRELSGIVSLGNGASITGTALYPEYSFIYKVPLLFLNQCDDGEKVKKADNNIIVCMGDEYDLPNQIMNVQQSQVPVAIFISKYYHIESILPTSFPALFLNPEQGQQILNYINSSKSPIASLQFHRTVIGAKPAPVVGDYSSRGPARSNPSVLKPDLIAPGTLILSSWPNSTPLASSGSDVLFSPFNLLWGTSMACPHVAGVGALLRSVHPDWSPAAIRSAMMTTADSLDNTHTPIKDFVQNMGPANPLALGAGHINPNNALNPGLVYDTHAADYINLLCSMKYNKKQIMSITRSSSFSCSRASSDLNYPSFIAFFNASISASKAEITQTFQRTLTNVGAGMSTYTANLSSINEVKVSVVPNKLVFKNKYDKQSFTVTIKGPARLDDEVVYGSLTWVEVGGKHVVRSPIAATRINSRDYQQC